MTGEDASKAILLTEDVVRFLAAGPGDVPLCNATRSTLGFRV